MLERHDRRWGPPRERGRRRRWLLRALALVVAVGVVALAGGFSPSQAPAPRLELTSLTSPTPPTNVVATGSDRALAISWTASTESFISGYRVYLDGTLRVTTSGTGTSTAISGLVNGQGYVVTVYTNTSLFGTSYSGTIASTPVSGTPRDAVPPVAPTGVTAVRGDASVVVSWTANTADYDADGYRVLRNGTAVSGLVTGRSTTTWTDTGLTNDTTYGYTVQTHDTSGNWSASSSPSVAATPTDLTAPSTPTGLVANRGDERVTLSWTANPQNDIATYRVLRAGVEVAAVPAGTTTWTDTGLTNDTTYSYALAAVDTHGNRSGTSAPAVSATPTDLTPPAAPTGLTAVRGDGSVALSWSPNGEADLASYRVLRGGVEIATVTGLTGWTDTGVVDDTTYSYTLVAVDTHGNRSAASAAAGATPTDLVPPGAPTGLTGGRGDMRAGLSWTANPESDLASYRVLRDGVEVATVHAGTTSWMDTGLTNDRTYTYALVAVDGHGNRSGASAAVQVTPTDLTPPAVPAGLTALRGDGAVSLSWTANGEPDLASYRVLRDGVEITWVAAGTTSFVDTGRTNDVTYSYALAAVDTHGNRSVSSSPVGATPTDLGAPSAPSGLTAVRGDGSVALAWSPNTEPDLGSYRVLRDGVEVATVPAGTTSTTDTGLTDDVTYTYTLVAVDTHGNRSVASSPASATPTDQTPPSAPTGLAVARGDERVTLTWTANPEPDVVSYRVLRDGTEIATVTGTGYVDGGLTNDAGHSWSLVAVDGHGNRSPASAAVAGTPTDLTAPAIPSGLIATRGDNQVTLTWSANTEDDLASYRVLRDGVEVATSTGATGWVDVGVMNDTTYTYTLVAVDTHGNRSPASPPATATPTDLTAPAAPTGLVAVAGDGSVRLTWTANGEPDLASYRVLRDGTEVAIVTGGTAYLDLPLANGTTYTYALVAVDTHGNRSVGSAPAAATPVDTTAPGVPTGLAATAGDGWATLTWTADGEPDLASYRVLRDGSEVAVVPAGTTTWTDTGLTDDTTYRYALAAVDTSGNRSAACAPVFATPADTTPPAVPVGLVATPGDGRVALAWTAGSEPDLASYRVLRDGVEIATVTGSTGYLDAGLVDGTGYGYALVAVDTRGNRSAASATVTATPRDTTAPAAPSGVLAAAGDRQVTLTWTPNSEQDLASYRVLRGGTEVATVLAGTTSWTDTGLTNGTTYAYALVALDTAGNRSAASTSVWATPIDTTAPAAPTGLAATPGVRRVTLTWTAVTDPDLASYRVLRDGVEVVTVLSGTGWVDTGLTEGVSHTYVVVAVDTSGNRSVPSAPVTASPADTTAPAAPTGLTATPGDRTVGLTWSPNGEPDLASYRVLRGGLEVATVTGTTSWTDPGLTDGTTYTYAIVAVDTAGNRSAASTPVDATPADPTPPAAPTGLAATPGDRQVVLSWSPNGEPDLASYRVLRGGAEVATVPAGTTTWTDATVTNGTAYGYALVAVDVSRNRSATSVAVTATPADAVAPGAPTSGSATAGSRSATVRWTAPADTDLASYRVLDGNGLTVATVAAPATTATVTGLTDGTPYRFTVVAVDTSGNVGPASAAVTVTPSSAPASVPTTGSGTSGGVAVSGDGRYVVVGTTAQLETSDTNTAYELYLVDRTARTAHRIAPLAAGATGSTDPTNTAAPAISDDGRYVALATTAALVPADRNGLLDVYRYDTTTGTWALASVPAGGAPSATAGTLLQTGATVYATSPAVAMSADGDLVLFYSARSDLVTGDTNGQVDLFATRMSTGAVTRVSTTSAGASITGVAATGPALALTPDGQYALFPVTPTAGGATLLYRKTLTGAQAGTLTLVSTVTVNGRATSFGVYRDTGDVAISSDGRYVALVTANQITTASPASAYTTGLAYRVDTSSGAVLALGNGQTTIWEHQVELDPTGRYGFFSTTAGELAADTNSHTDAYRRDLAGDVAGPLLLVSADASGQPTAGPSGSVTTAEYGRVRAVTGDSVLLTTSQALLPSDTNRVRDLYAKDLVTGSVASAL